MARFLSPAGDVLFKAVFGDGDDTEALRSFLAAVLGWPADELSGLEVRDPQWLRQRPDEKQTVFDVLAKTVSGDSIEIEVQLLRQPAFEGRLVYYAAQMLTGQLLMGRGYDVLRRAISVAVMDFTLVGGDGDYHHRFRMFDDDHSVALTDLLQVHLLEIPKVPQVSDGSLLWKWLRFMGARSRRELAVAAKSDPVIAKAVSKVSLFTEADIDAYFRRRRDILEKDAIVHDNQMRAEGRADGLAEARAEFARSLLADGESVGRVAALAKLSEDEVAALARV